MWAPTGSLWTASSAKAVLSPPSKCARHLRALVYTRTHWAEMYSTSPRRVSNRHEAQDRAVNDKVQRGYTYELVAPSGRGFAEGFEPELTRLRCFGSVCSAAIYDRLPPRVFPKSWFASAKLSPDRRDPSLNFFGVDASQPLSLWRRKGWLHPDDPRGWFQWYCRYYMGRRLPQEDARQIRRWKQIKRHVAQVKRHCEKGDLTCRKRQRQAIAALGLR